MLIILEGGALLNCSCFDLLLKQVLSTVVALLDAHENGPPSEGPFAELYESLSGSPSSSSNSPSDGSSNSSSSTKDEASPFDEGPMTARVLGALLRGVRLHDFKCVGQSLLIPCCCYCCC